MLGCALLVIFKYYNFLNENITTLLQFAGLHFELPGLNYAVPVGISFFTFQALGYLFDVYFKKIEPEESLSNYVLFVSFFPQITSGPISKASELLPQIKAPKPFNYAQAVEGLRFLLWGMFMKVAVADRLGLYVDAVYSNYENYAGLSCLFAIIFYSFQIYADFAGYSFMALGIAKVLGYDVINNFQQPYLAFGVTDFWRRWHISLSRWLKDYIYIPLGGSRRGNKRTHWNILVTFFVSGIWHGAAWNFIVWGLLHGIFQVIEKAFGIQKTQTRNPFIKGSRILITFILVSIAWIFFRMNTLDDALGVMNRVAFHFQEGEILTQQRSLIMLVLPVLILKDVYNEYLQAKPHRWNCTVTRWALYLFLFLSILLLGVLDSGQFIYISF